jgi:hypothetical protein
MINFNQDDENSKQILVDLKRQINIYWERSEAINGDYFNKYKILFKKCKSILNKIDNKFTDKESKKSIIDYKILALSWEEYFNKIQNDNVNEIPKNYMHSFNGRLNLLEKANGYFRKYNSFEKMYYDERKKIAGSTPIEENDFNWAWFGSMKGAGTFNGKVKDNNTHISNALDCIPLNGKVSHQNYTDYIDNFRKAFPLPKGRDGIATATRLLSMKRPDVFICLDNENEDNLCKNFDIKMKNNSKEHKAKRYEEYWTEIIVKIQETDWWKSEKPKDEIELKAWNGRVAMLDVYFYKPNIDKE